MYQTSAEAWREVIDIDLTGVFNTIRAVGPGMVERGYGRIIATASMMGRTGAPNLAGYASAKWGVIGLVKCAAHDFAPHGVTVNAIAPGNVDTPMIQNEAVRKLMRKDLEHPTREDAAAAFQRLDADGDGRLSRADVIRLTAEFFKSDDPKAAGNALFGQV